MDIDEKEAIKAKFGEINYAGLEQLEELYDTYQINRSIDVIRKAIATLQQSLENIERLKAGADELVDGEHPFCSKHYSVDDCGDIGYFAEEICSDLDSCSESIEKACEQLAPLQRLMPTDDGEVFIDFRDTLDKKKNKEEDDDWV